MKKILRKIFYAFCILLDWKHDRKARILMYHSFNVPNVFFNVTSGNFQKQIQYLKRKNYTFLTISGLVERIKKNESLNKVVVLTFDDAHIDFKEIVVPLVKDIPVTIFWPTQISELVSTQGVICKLLSKTEIEPIKRSSNVEVGSHTATHPELPQISFEEQKRELTQSYNDISALGQKNISFAYPRGKYNEQIKKLTKSVGYCCACTVQPGAVNNKSDLFALPRISIDSSTDFFAFRAKLSWLYATIYSI